MGLLNWLYTLVMSDSLEQRQGQKYAGRPARIRKSSKLYKGWGHFGVGTFDSLPYGAYFGVIDFSYGGTCAVEKKDVEFVKR